MHGAGLVAPVGGWRVQACWRVIGFGICQLQHLRVVGGGIDSFADLAERGWEFSIAFAIGPLLLLFGARVITLALCAIGMTIYMLPVLLWNVEEQLAEEYVLFPALALMTLIALGAVRAAPAAGRGLEAQDDRAALGVLRVAALAVLGFAAFHKLNVDFFDPEVSCATVLVEDMLRYWDFGWIEPLVAAMPPLAIVLGEALIPLLLPFAPLPALAFGLLFMGAIALVGPVGFVMTALGLCLSFLEERDREPIVAGFRRRWPWLLAAIALAWLLAWSRYREPDSLAQFLLHIAGVGTLLFAVLCALLARRPREWLRGEGWRGLWPVGRGARLAIGAFALLCLVNGFTPYLGAKFRISFAMLSNLRVDSVRWNHYLVPAALHPGEHDPFVHVLHFRYDAEDVRRYQAMPERGKRALSEAMFSPLTFRHRLEWTRRAGIDSPLELFYRGRTLRFDGVSDPALDAFVADLPRDKLLHDWLNLSGPQRCVH